MTSLTGFWGFTISVILSVLIGYGAIWCRFRFNLQGWIKWLLAAAPITWALFWFISVIYIPAVQHRQSPFTYLLTWSLILLGLNLWFSLSVVKESWGVRCLCAIIHFVRKGGFWGNWRSSSDNAVWPGTTHNAWANHSFVIWLIFGVLWLMHGSPWYNDGADALHSAKGVVQNTANAATSVASKVTDGVLGILKKGFEGTNTFINEALKDVQPGSAQSSPASVAEAPPLPLYPRSWGLLVFWLVFTLWVLFSFVWSRRDFVSDRLESFADWMRRRRRASSTVTGTAETTPVTPPVETGTPPSPEGGASTTSTLGQEVGKEIVAEGAVEAIKTALERGIRGISSLLRFKRRR